MTKFGSKNADLAYGILSDGKSHVSHEFNVRIGWDWRKAVSLVKKYGERTGEFEVRSVPEKIGQTTVKRYWIVRKNKGIVEQLADLKHPVVSKVIEETKLTINPLFNPNQGKLL